MWEWCEGNGYTILLGPLAGAILLHSTLALQRPLRHVHLLVILSASILYPTVGPSFHLSHLIIWQWELTIGGRLIALLATYTAALLCLPSFVVADGTELERFQLVLLRAWRWRWWADFIGCLYQVATLVLLASWATGNDGRLRAALYYALVFWSCRLLSCAPLVTLALWPLTFFCKPFAMQRTVSAWFCFAFLVLTWTWTAIVEGIPWSSWLSLVLVQDLLLLCCCCCSQLEPPAVVPTNLRDVMLAYANGLRDDLLR